MFLRAGWWLYMVASAAAQIKLDPNIKMPRMGVLYPRASESREVLSLDGVWSFILDSTESPGLYNHWYLKNISEMAGAIPMPVPSSYNDITFSPTIRDWVGKVWYERKFFVPDSWRAQNTRVWLRFGSVNYMAIVWVNGKKLMAHEIGHLPFQGDVTTFLKFGQENKVTVIVDNILDQETIPQGYLHNVSTMMGTKVVQKYTFDFFNYAGIHRSVYLYTTPLAYIDDVKLNSEVENGIATVEFNISYRGIEKNINVSAEVVLEDKEGNQVGCARVIPKVFDGNASGEIIFKDPKLWWPYLMHDDPGYLYTVKISLYCSETNQTDVYRMPYGIRTLKWDTNSIFINDKPIYIRGFGRHEDSDIRGKGLDLPTAVRDHDLLKWIGANAYRTSHYPYAEEIMDLAEAQGIMIIDESPSVNTENFTQELLTKHKAAIAEMINRDKNRACVIMWSVANEPRTAVAGAGPYFGSVVAYTRTKDGSRPITAVLNRWYTFDQVGQFMDVICFNRYNAWYTEPGQIDSIQLAVESEAMNWRTKHLKPVIMTEYGADTYEGLHNLPTYIWTEEYQMGVMSEHFKAFDNLREKEWFIGEMIWNFADFKTDQSITRVGGNKKGVFTRNRQPKAAAFLLRKRNLQLALELEKVPLPPDLELYSSNYRFKNEL